jgi:tetratricopeptide (TPR) repeat protein
LQRAGDHSETVSIGLALGLVAKASALDNQASPEALPTATRATVLLEPIATAPNASLESRRAYVEAMQRLGFQQLRAQRLAEAERTLRKAIAIAAASGAGDLSAPDMTAWYVNCVAWLVETLGDLGKHDEARRIGAEASALGDRLLELRPAYTLALRGRQLLASSLGGLIIDDMHIAEGLAHLRRSIAVSASLLRLDPDSIIAANNLAADIRSTADAYAALGDPQQGVATMRTAFAPMKVAERGGSSFILNAMFVHNQLAQRLTDMADDAAARPVLADVGRSLEEMTKRAAPGSAVLLFGQCSRDVGSEFVALIRGDNAEARAAGQRCLARLEPLKPTGPTDDFNRNIYLFYGGWGVSRAEVELGDYAAAERHARAALAARTGWPVGNNSDLRDRAQVQTTLAIVLARRGDTAAAAREIAPVVELHRRLATRNRDDATQRFELATALYAAALADPARRAALLTEAASLLASLPPQLRALRSMRHWQTMIDAARAAA